MSDRDALLAAITAEPDDDTPRLVYADWLDEHGEAERAEFIRLQCRIHHMRAGGAGWNRLLKREKELRVKLFSRLDAAGFADLTFSRGFVGTVESGVLDFRDRAAVLTPDLAPAFALTLAEDERDAGVWEKDYDEYARVVGEVARRPELLRCVSADLPCLGMLPFEAFVTSPRLTSLRRLNAPENEAGPAVELVASPTFANLRWANFHNSDSAADCPSLIPLAQCPHLANLEYLDFGDCEQPDQSLEVLAGAAHWAKLAYLDLSTSFFSTEAIGEFFRTRRLPALEELDLSDALAGRLRSGKCDPDDGFAAATADTPLFARLRKIGLRRNGITDAGAVALANSPREMRLTHIDLRDNPIGAAGKRALRKRFGKDVCLFGTTR